MPIANPRPAATVVVLRSTPHADGFEVLMVRRHDKVAFMGGAYVFPGGRVDEVDGAGDAGPETGWPVCFPDLDTVQEAAFRRAAVRELFEEANVSVRAADLIPLAHWVTPEIEPRRYDTRFFLVRMPEGQQATHDDHETTALAWFPPAEALDRCRRREIKLPPPTWTTLSRLARHRSIEDVLEWAAWTPIVRVQPNLIRDGGRTLLTLPGDSSYPTIEGWDVPEDTRFVLEEGQWRPVRV